MRWIAVAKGVTEYKIAVEADTMAEAEAKVMKYANGNRDVAEELDETRFEADWECANITAADGSAGKVVL